jgi:hypothetical protein
MRNYIFLVLLLCILAGNAHSAPVYEGLPSCRELATTSTYSNVVTKALVSYAFQAIGPIFEKNKVQLVGSPTVLQANVFQYGNYEEPRMRFQFTVRSSEGSTWLVYGTDPDFSPDYHEPQSISLQIGQEDMIEQDTWIGTNCSIHAHKVASKRGFGYSPIYPLQMIAVAKYDKDQLPLGSVFIPEGTLILAVCADCG